MPPLPRPGLERRTLNKPSKLETEWTLICSTNEVNLMSRRVKTVRVLLLGEKHKVFDGATVNTYVASEKINAMPSKRLEIGILCDHSTNDIKYTVKACFDRDIASSTFTLKTETTKLHTDAEPDQEFTEGSWDQVWVEVKNAVTDAVSSAKVWINEKGV